MVRGSLNVSPESWLVAASRQWQSERLCQQTISLRESFCLGVRRPSVLAKDLRQQAMPSRRLGSEADKRAPSRLTVGLVGPTWLRESMMMSPLERSTSWHSLKPSSTAQQRFRVSHFVTTHSRRQAQDRCSRPFPVPQSRKEAALSYSSSASKSRRCRPRARRRSPAGAGCSCRCCRGRRRAAGHDAPRAAAAARLHLPREKTLISSREQTTTNGLHMTSRNGT